MHISLYVYENMLTLATSQRDAFILKRVPEKKFFRYIQQAGKILGIVFLGPLSSVFDPGPSAPYYYPSTKIFIYSVEELANANF